MNAIWEFFTWLGPILGIPVGFAIAIVSIIFAGVLSAAWVILWRRDYHVVQHECLEWNQTTKKYQLSSYQEVRPGPGP